MVRSKQRAKIEKVLMEAVIFGSILLALTQGLLTDPETRQALSLIDKLEGQPLTQLPTISSSISVEQLEFMLTNVNAAPKASIVINGKSQAFFTSRVVTVAVRDGDLIEFDTRNYQGVVRLKLIHASNKIIFPAPGTEYVSKSAKITIGRAVFASNRPATTAGPPVLR